MSKSSDLARTSARGGFNVLWGMILSSIISAIGTIIVGNTIPREEVGIIAIVLSGPTMISFIRDLGIDQAIIKHTTQYRTEKNTEKLANTVIAGTSFELIVGIAFTVVSFLLSGVMANIQGRPTLLPMFQIASITILAGGLLKVAQSVFIGYEKMALHSITMIINSTLKTALMVILITLSFGVNGAIIGQVTAYLSAGLISFAMLYLIIITKMRKHNFKLQFVSTIKSMLTFGLPLSIATMLIGVLAEFYVFLSAIYATDLMMGNYYMAINFAMLVSVFATSVSTIMFPTFSKIKAQEDPKTLRAVFQYSVKYTSLLIVPLTFAVIALSGPGVESLFQNQYEFTPLFLSLYVLTFLYAAIGNLSAGSLISSQGKTKINMKLTMLTFIIGFILSWILIPPHGIYGLLATHLISGVPGLIIALWWINKHYNATVDWVSSIKIVGISAFSAVLTNFVINKLNLTSWMGLIVGTPLFLGTYIIAAPLVGAVTYDDTKNLKDAVKSLGPLAVAISFLLYPIEKIAKTKQKNSNR